MEKELCRLLNEAIETYNDYADEHEQLYWWDILNEIADMTDEDEVMRIILRIERAAEGLMAKEAAGF